MLIGRGYHFFFILALLAGGCQEFLPAPPRPSEVVPASAKEGEEVAVTIEGANFFPDVLISYRDENNSHIRTDFWARLGETELLEVTYVDSATLTARVPGTLASGEYDLTVEDPLGRTGRLAGAFRVDRLIECQQDIDCQDPCYSGARCVDNRCVMGEVIKDSDDDGFIDRACPGGDDCDDDPAGCGADCHPGLVDYCDGYDNDCDGVVDGDWTPSSTCGLGVCRAEEVCNGQAGVDCTPGPADEVSELTCDDNLDNDCDGLTDGADPSCGSAPNTPPLPAILVTPAAGETGTLFEASALGTTDREQDPATLTYSWDWNDDGTFEDSGQVVSRTLSTAGSYSVVLQVRDSGNLAAYATFVVIVSESSDLLIVTTPEDEEDSGAAPGPDFSLREAMVYAGGLAGHQHILVPDGMVISLISTLSGFSDPDGVTIIGDGADLDGSGLGSGHTCLEIDGSNNRLLGLEIRNCPDYAVTVLAGGGNQFSRCYLHDSGDGVYLLTPGNQFGPDNQVAYNTDWGLYAIASTLVFGNAFHDNGSVGIRLVSAAGSTLWQNVVIRNEVGIDLGTGNDGVMLYHNTVHASTQTGLRVFSNASNLDLRNNIISQSAGWALTAKDDNFAFIDYNDFFDNTSGICSACSIGANGLTDDPLYIDPASDDLRLAPDSTMIDSGFDLGLDLDLNGPQAGNYNGSAPDRGYWEWP